MYRRVHIWLKEDKYYLKDKMTADIQLYAEVWAKLHVLLIFEVKSTQPLEKTILKILNVCKY